MVEPERVLHSVMVIAFERKGAIDEDLKIIKAIQNELNLGNVDTTYMIKNNSVPVNTILIKANTIIFFENDMVIIVT